MAATIAAAAPIKATQSVILDTHRSHESRQRISVLNSARLKTLSRSRMGSLTSDWYNRRKSSVL